MKTKEKMDSDSDKDTVKKSKYESSSSSDEEIKQKGKISKNKIISKVISSSSSDSEEEKKIPKKKVIKKSKKESSSSDSEEEKKIPKKKTVTKPKKESSSSDSEEEKKIVKKKTVKKSIKESSSSDSEEEKKITKKKKPIETKKRLPSSSSSSDSEEEKKIIPKKTVTKSKKESSSSSSSSDSEDEKKKIIPKKSKISKQLKESSSSSSTSDSKKDLKNKEKKEEKKKTKEIAQPIKSEPMDIETTKSETKETETIKSEPMEIEITKSEPMETEIIKSEPMNALIYESTAESVRGMLFFFLDTNQPQLIMSHFEQVQKDLLLDFGENSNEFLVAIDPNKTVPPFTESLQGIQGFMRNKIGKELNFEQKGQMEKYLLSKMGLLPSVGSANSSIIEEIKSRGEHPLGIIFDFLASIRNLLKPLRIDLQRISCDPAKIAGMDEEIWTMLSGVRDTQGNCSFMPKTSPFPNLGNPLIENAISLLSALFLTSTEIPLEKTKNFATIFVDLYEDICCFLRVIFNTYKNLGKRLEKEAIPWITMSVLKTIRTNVLSLAAFFTANAQLFISNFSQKFTSDTDLHRFQFVHHTLVVLHTLVPKDNPIVDVFVTGSAPSIKQKYKEESGSESESDEEEKSSKKKQKTSSSQKIEFSFEASHIVTRFCVPAFFKFLTSAKNVAPLLYKLSKVKFINQRFADAVGQKLEEIKNFANDFEKQNSDKIDEETRYVLNDLADSKDLCKEFQSCFFSDSHGGCFFTDSNNMKFVRTSVEICGTILENCFKRSLYDVERKLFDAEQTNAVKAEDMFNDVLNLVGMFNEEFLFARFVHPCFILERLREDSQEFMKNLEKNLFTMLAKLCRISVILENSKIFQNNEEFRIKFYVTMLYIFAKFRLAFKTSLSFPITHIIGPLVEKRKKQISELISTKKRHEKGVGKIVENFEAVLEDEFTEKAMRFLTEVETSQQTTMLNTKIGDLKALVKRSFMSFAIESYLIDVRKGLPKDVQKAPVLKRIKEEIFNSLFRTIFESKTTKKSNDTSSLLSQKVVKPIILKYIKSFTEDNAASKVENYGLKDPSHKEDFLFFVEKILFPFGCLSHIEFCARKFVDASFYKRLNIVSEKKKILDKFSDEEMSKFLEFAEKETQANFEVEKIEQLKDEIVNISLGKKELSSENEILPRIENFVLESTNPVSFFKIFQAIEETIIKSEKDESFESNFFTSENPGHFDFFFKEKASIFKDLISTTLSLPKLFKFIGFILFYVNEAELNSSSKRKKNVREFTVALFFKLLKEISSLDSEVPKLLERNIFEQAVLFMTNHPRIAAIMNQKIAQMISDESSKAGKMVKISKKYFSSSMKFFLKKHQELETKEPENSQTKTKVFTLLEEEISRKKERSFIVSCQSTAILTFSSILSKQILPLQVQNSAMAQAFFASDLNSDPLSLIFQEKFTERQNKNIKEEKTTTDSKQAFWDVSKKLHDLFSKNILQFCFAVDRGLKELKDHIKVSNETLAGFSKLPLVELYNLASEDTDSYSFTKKFEDPTSVHHLFLFFFQPEEMVWPQYILQSSSEFKSEKEFLPSGNLVEDNYLVAIQRKKEVIDKIMCVTESKKCILQIEQDIEEKTKSFEKVQKKSNAIVKELKKFFARENKLGEAVHQKNISLLKFFFSFFVDCFQDRDSLKTLFFARKDITPAKISLLVSFLLSFYEGTLSVKDLILFDIFSLFESCEIHLFQFMFDFGPNSNLKEIFECLVDPKSEISQKKLEVLKPFLNSKLHLVDNMIAFHDFDKTICKFPQQISAFHSHTMAVKDANIDFSTEFSSTPEFWNFFFDGKIKISNIELQNLTQELTGKVPQTTHDPRFVLRYISFVFTHFLDFEIAKSSGNEFAQKKSKIFSAISDFAKTTNPLSTSAFGRKIKKENSLEKIGMEEKEIFYDNLLELLKSRNLFVGGLSYLIRSLSSIDQNIRSMAIDILIFLNDQFQKNRSNGLKLVVVVSNEMKWEQKKIARKIEKEKLELGNRYDPTSPRRAVLAAKAKFDHLSGLRRKFIVTIQKLVVLENLLVAVTNMTTKQAKRIPSGITMVFSESLGVLAEFLESKSDIDSNHFFYFLNLKYFFEPDKPAMKYAARGEVMTKVPILTSFFYPKAATILTKRGKQAILDEEYEMAPRLAEPFIPKILDMKTTFSAKILNEIMKHSSSLNSDNLFTRNNKQAQIQEQNDAKIVRKLQILNEAVTQDMQFFTKNLIRTLFLENFTLEDFGNAEQILHFDEPEKKDKKGQKEIEKSLIERLPVSNDILKTIFTLFNQSHVVQHFVLHSFLEDFIEPTISFNLNSKSSAQRLNNAEKFKTFFGLNFFNSKIEISEGEVTEEVVRLWHVILEQRILFLEIIKKLFKTFSSDNQDISSLVFQNNEEGSFAKNLMLGSYSKFMEAKEIVCNHKQVIKNILEVGLMKLLNEEKETKKGNDVVLNLRSKLIETIKSTIQAL